MSASISQLSSVLATLKNPDVFEKYLALASAIFFSAAWGLTISNPWNDTKTLLLLGF